MLKLLAITVLICATSVITSSVSSDPGVLRFRTKPITQLEKTLSNDNINAVPTKSDTVIHQADTINSLTSTFKYAARPTVVAEVIKLMTKDSVLVDSKSKLPKTRNASVVARKGAIPTSKILPRKGVELETPTMLDSSMEGIDEAVNLGALSVKIPRKEADDSSGKINERNITNNMVTDKKSGAKYISIPTTTNNTNTTIRIMSTTRPTLEKVVSTIETKNENEADTSFTTSPKRFKPKPTVTIGEVDIDKPIPASPTKTPPLGMPRKIDYIVPVVITIMALPLLGGAAFFLYRRGRDCWDKRHYRRMDFLIDGMYNDYSWK